MNVDDKMQGPIMGMLGIPSGAESLTPPSRESAKSQLQFIIAKLGREGERGARQCVNLQALYDVLPERLEEAAEQGLYDLLEQARRGKGMSLRTYACLHLGVPQTGVDWLDALIRKGQRQKVAGMVLPGLLAASSEFTIAMRSLSKKKGIDTSTLEVQMAFELADAFLAHRDRREAA